MSKQTFATIVVITLFLLIVGGMVWFFLFRAPVPTAPGEEAPSGFFGRLFPSSQQPGGSSGGQGGIDGVDGEGDERDEQPAPRLRLVSEEPVAGAVVFGSATTTTIRYVERATGHIYDAPAAVLKTTRISNETIPGLQRALFSSDGSSLLLQYLDGDQLETVKTFGGGLIATSSGERVRYEGGFLPDSVAAVDYAPDSEQVAYLVETSEGSAAYVADANGDSATRIATLPVREWLLEWATPSRLLLVTKPSGRSEGAAYTLNTNTGALARIIGGINGLTATLNPDGAALLYSEGVEDSVRLRSYTLSSQEVLDIPLATFPMEKCVWESVEIMYCAVPNTLRAGDYPDVWYQGRVSFADSIWRIDVVDGASEQIINPVETDGEQIDAVHLSLSPDGRYLVFQNKNDLRLWSLRVGE